MNYEPEWLRIWQVYVNLSLMVQSQATHLLWNGKPYESRVPAYGVSSLYSAIGVWLSATQSKATGDYPNERTNADIYLYTREVISFRGESDGHE